MFSIPEQFSSAAKSQLETQLKILNTLTSKAFEGAEQIIALNISTGKAALEQSTSKTRQLLALKDPRDLFTLAANPVQPGIENLLAYSRALFGIASGTQADLLASVKPAVPAPAVAALRSAPAAVEKIAAPEPASPTVAQQVAPVIAAEEKILAAPPAAAVTAAPAAPEVKAKAKAEAEAKAEAKAEAEVKAVAEKTVAAAAPAAKAAAAAPAAKPVALGKPGVAAAAKTTAPAPAKHAPKK